MTVRGHYDCMLQGLSWVLLIAALAIWVVGGTDKVLVTFVDDVVELGETII